MNRRKQKTILVTGVQAIALSLILTNTAVASTQVHQRAVGIMNAQLGRISEGIARQQVYLEAKVLHNGPLACSGSDALDQVSDGRGLSGLVASVEMDDDCAFRFTLKNDNNISTAIKNMTITMFPLAAADQDFTENSSHSIIGWRCEVSGAPATTYYDPMGIVRNRFSFSQADNLTGCVVPGTPSVFAAVV